MIKCMAVRCNPYSRPSPRQSFLEQCPTMIGYRRLVVAMMMSLTIGQSGTERTINCSDTQQIHRPAIPYSSPLVYATVRSHAFCSCLPLCLHLYCSCPEDYDMLVDEGLRVMYSIQELGLRCVHHTDFAINFAKPADAQIEVNTTAGTT
jgi:hypothetical protein